MICCGTAMTMKGLLGVSAKMVKTLTVEMVTVTLTVEGIILLTCAVHKMYEINRTIFS